MLSVVKMLQNREVGGCELNSHGNYIVDHGKSWKNHGIVFLNFCGNPGFGCSKEQSHRDPHFEYPCIFVEKEED